MKPQALAQSIKSITENILLSIMQLSAKLFQITGEFLADEITAENEHFYIKIKRKNISNN